MTQVTYDIKDIDLEKLEELILAKCSFALGNIKNRKSLMADIERIMTKHDLKTKSRREYDILATAAVVPSTALLGGLAANAVVTAAGAAVVATAGAVVGCVAGVSLPIAYLISRRSGEHDYEIIINRNPTRLTINYRKPQ